jgi:hypothetical protein
MLQLIILGQISQNDYVNSHVNMSTSENFKPNKLRKETLRIDLNFFKFLFVIFVIRKFKSKVL